MKRFCLFINKKKEKAEETAAFVREYLLSHSAETVMDSEDLFPEELYGIDCVISLGGDGTIIRAARRIAGTGIPIIGINIGHLGYLTAVSDREEIPGMLNALLSGNYSIEERMMLEGTIMHENPGMPAEPNSHLALNEVVLFRSPSGAASHFRVLVNGAFLNEYKADGIIISTPTGSTAYNLSAGGPIVDPAARMTILTPICAHALNRSSIVLRAEDTIEVVVSSDQEGIQSVSFDGAVTKELRAGSRVRVTGSDLRTPLIRLSGGTFFTQLRSKMTVL
ncbi:MAG: NAD(+)/NADH kinase [Stomatobaculum sp.]|nr:NAD(+)/NADH kinase [Stomatobaculum sp.]